MAPCDRHSADSDLKVCFGRDVATEGELPWRSMVERTRTLLLNILEEEQPPPPPLPPSSKSFGLLSRFRFFIVTEVKEGGEEEDGGAEDVLELRYKALRKLQKMC